MVPMTEGNRRLFGEIKFAQVFNLFIFTSYEFLFFCFCLCQSIDSRDKTSV